VCGGGYGPHSPKEPLDERERCKCNIIGLIDPKLSGGELPHFVPSGLQQGAACTKVGASFMADEVA